MLSSSRESLIKLALTVSCLLALWAVASDIIGVVRDFSPVPFWDQWDGYIDFYMHSADGWSAFWRPHNEHRIVISKMIFWADIRWFQGRNVLALAANLAFMCAQVVSFVWIACRYIRGTRARVAVAAGVSVLLFSWVQWENLIWAFQDQWFSVFMFALLSFHCLERSASDRRIRWIALALLCAFASVGSMANGLLTFPALAVMGLFFRIGWRRVALLVALTAAMIATYSHGLTSSSDASLLAAMRTFPHEIARFLILYIGSPPWGAMQRIDLSFAFGVAVLFGAVLAALLMAVRVGHPDKINGVAFVALAWFVLLSGFLTGAGRVPTLGSGVAVASRYETAALVAWASLLVFYAVNCTTRIQWTCLAIAWIVAAAVVIPYQRQAVHPLSARTFDLDVAGLALRAGIYDSPRTALLSQNPDRLRDVAKAAQSEGISIFSDSSPDYPTYGSPVRTTTSCIGNVEAISRASRDSTLAQITGWAYGLDGKPAEQIVITDPLGHPIGYGVTGQPRPDIAASTGAKDNRAGWLAFFAPRPDYVVVVISADGNRCFLAR